MVGKAQPHAMLLNSDDWGYGHFLLDEDSVKCFEGCLSKIKSNIDRATVIGQIMFMVRQIEYPATRFPKIMN